MEAERVMAGLNWLLGLPTSFQQYSTLRTDNQFKTFGAFVQDDWKVALQPYFESRLRYEPYFGIHDGHDEIIAYRPGQQSTLFPTLPRSCDPRRHPGVSASTYNKDWNNFAPRIGFAWLPFGPDSKTTVRSAYGVFYNTERGYLSTKRS